MNYNTHPYNGKCAIPLVVDIHHNNVEIPEVLVDTGFTSGTTFGLKLSECYAPSSGIGIGQIKLANGIEVPAKFILDLQIIKIGNYQLKNPLRVKTCFMEGPSVIGVLVLQRCKINFDGPNQQAKFYCDL